MPTIRALKAAEAQNPSADDVADPGATAVKGYRQRFATLGLAGVNTRRFASLGLAGIDTRRFASLAFAGLGTKRFSSLGLTEAYTKRFSSLAFAGVDPKRFSSLAAAGVDPKRFSSLASAGVDPKRFSDLIASVQASGGVLHQEASATGRSVDWLLFRQSHCARSLPPSCSSLWWRFGRSRKTPNRHPSCWSSSVRSGSGTRSIEQSGKSFPNRRKVCRDSGSIFPQLPHRS